MRTIIIGDIHGCYYTMLALLKKVEYRKEEDILVFVGDYIDRGRYSYEVVEYLINLQREAGKDRCICLKGNHGQLAYMDEQLWKLNGGGKTIQSYYRNNVRRDIHHDWFRSLPLYYETDTIIVTHAGLPKERLEDNGEEDMLWDRNWLMDVVIHPKLVIFGHTEKGTGKLLNKTIK